MVQNGAGRRSNPVKVSGLRRIMDRLDISPAQVKKSVNPWTSMRFIPDGRTFDQVYDSGFCRSDGTLDNIAQALSHLSGYAITKQLLIDDHGFDPRCENALWVPKNLGPVQTFENNLRYLRCEFEYARDPSRRARGKIYGLEEIPEGQTRDSIEHWLYRHHEVCIDASGNNPNLMSTYWCGRSHRKAEWHVVDHWVEGRRLSDILFSDRKRTEAASLLSYDQTRAIAFGLLDGLEALHQAGYIMRTLTPDKVMICGDQYTPVITDFELARYQGNLMTVSGDRTSDVWRDNRLFIAPEARKDGPIDARADLFSWAVVMLCAIEGCLLFDKNELSRACENLKKSEVLRAQAKSAIQACLSPVSSKRPESVRSLRNLIESW